AIKSTALTPAKTRTLKWPGELEALLIEGKLGYAPIGAYLAYDVWTETTPELSSGTSFFSKKFYKLHNFLKGGTYRHHFEKPDEKYAVNPRITFKDIIGMNHAKEILSVIVKYMENPETFDGRKLTPEKGYLLTGPTRTGKTFIVEGLAGEIKEMYKRKGKRPEDFHFFVLNANFILQGGIKSLIEEAKALSPCILFIDEIDLLSLQRGSGNAALLSEFLTAMSGALENDPDKVVIIIAATNKPENLDIALRQRGRLGKEIRFEYPNYQERKEFFERRISKLANLNNFDIPQLARETEGKSFEDMNALIRTAFQRGILRGQTLTHKLLEASLDEEVRNIIMSDSTLSPEEKQLVAIHMAGQALAVVLLKNEQLAKVTIKPFLANVKEESAFDQFYKHELQQQKKIKNGRIYTFRQHDTKNINSYTQKLALCQQALAGFAAEKIILGACGYSNHPESGQQALDIATSIIAEGIDIHNQHFPQELKAKYLEKALALKKKCDEEITALLERHKEALQAITQALIEKETLTGKEVMEIAGLKVE
ncbi:MAG TPA: AAA family ATPase, partial [Candidatus Limnocylindria bacterium]|nr:AAA family ATPase [Candidatus Limnocylindria bacterium]